MTLMLMSDVLILTASPIAGVSCLASVVLVRAPSKPSQQGFAAARAWRRGPVFVTLVVGIRMGLVPVMVMTQPLSEMIDAMMRLMMR